MFNAWFNLLYHGSLMGHINYSHFLGLPTTYNYFALVFAWTCSYIVIHQKWVTTTYRTAGKSILHITSTHRAKLYIGGTLVRICLQYHISHIICSLHCSEVVLKVPLRYKLQDQHHWVGGSDTAKHLEDMWVVAV